MPPKKRTSGTPEEKTFHVRIHLPNAEAYRTLPVAQMDTACMGGVRTREDGSLELHALVPESALSKMKAARYKVEVLADVGEEAKKKQRQVGRGNRFAGEQSVPRGTGTKVREEGRS